MTHFVYFFLLYENYSSYYFTRCKLSLLIKFSKEDLWGCRRNNFHPFSILKQGFDRHSKKCEVSRPSSLQLGYCEIFRPRKTVFVLRWNFSYCDEIDRHIVSMEKLKRGSCPVVVEEKFFFFFFFWNVCLVWMWRTTVKNLFRVDSFQNWQAKGLINHLILFINI